MSKRGSTDRNRVIIDKEKLYKTLKKRGLKPAEASVEMGHDQAYLAKYASSGYLTRATAVQLKAMWGISAEDISPDPEPEPDQISVLPEKPAPASALFSMADRLTLDKAIAEIEGLKLAVSAHRQTIDSLNETLRKIAEHMAHFDALISDPMKLYRTIFIPMYNGIRVAEKDSAAQPVTEVKRRIDGTPIQKQ